MAKVFRLHSGKDGEDWFDSSAYGVDVINLIPDPSGASARKQITSIPSPFARMDLVRTAFRNVNNISADDPGGLNGSTIYHKIVSDALDVGEILFNMGTLNGVVEITAWDPASDLPRMLQSTNPKHKRLGECIKLYLEQDADAYNFRSVSRLYLIKSNFTVIGGTSPSTLFFSASNASPKVNITFGSHRVFSDEYLPLYRRDFEYQRFLGALFRLFPNLVSFMGEVHEYLEINRRALEESNPDWFKRLSNEVVHGGIDRKEYLARYSALHVGEQAGNIVEILGNELRQRKVVDDMVEIDSDFIIDSSIYTIKPRPLALQNNFTRPLRYVPNGNWSKDTKIPYEVEDELTRRTLPGQNIRYPFVTVGDFLEPQLIKLAYSINKTRFFDGNIRFDGSDKSGYVLPLKRLFFDFFSAEDLKNRHMPDGKRMFEMVVGEAGGVEVFLRVPIKRAGEYVTFNRLYYPVQGQLEIPKAAPGSNKGIVLESQFGLAVFPTVWVDKPDVKNHFRIQLIDRDIAPLTKGNRYQLSFWRGTSGEIPQKLRNRSDKNSGTDPVSTHYYILEEKFDFVQVNTGVAKGIIIPLMQKATLGNDEFAFAVDFGTTNTHIEYRKNNSDPKAFDITKEDIQVATFADLRDAVLEKAPELSDFIVMEFVPETLGPGSEYKFPHRTVIAEDRRLNLDEVVFALADFNIPFAFERRALPKSKRTRTNLKWSNYPKSLHEETRIKAFFEILMFLMRNKVLINGGSLENMKVIWSYPTSMLPTRRDHLEKTWADLFKLYIGGAPNPDSLRRVSESLAPFYFYSRRASVFSDLPVVSIDIGGETTDVAVFMSRKPLVLTSFRFAGNAIFGDAYNNSIEQNGFVQRYLTRFGQILQDNNVADLKAIPEMLLQEGKSTDAIAFFFSLEANSTLLDKGLRISFGEMLSKDEDLKFVFVTFYGALLYHIAKMMHSLGLSMPRFLTFSGMGSKVLRVLDVTTSLKRLTDFSMIAFQEVYGTPYDKGGLELKIGPEPKEITAKGALLSPVQEEVDGIKQILLGTETPELVRGGQLKYLELSEEKRRSVTKEVEKFLDFLFALDKQFSFVNNFGISRSRTQAYREILTRNLNSYLNEGIERAKEEATDATIEETMFFFPLVGALNELASRIVLEKE